MFKEHNVSRLVDSDALWEHVSPAHQTRERIVRWLCGFLHRRVGENCGAGGPRVLGAFLCLPLERFSGEIIVKGLGSQIVLLEHRVTQLPAENLWHRERSWIGLLLFLVERAAIPKFQKAQLANDLVEVGPNAAPFAASLLEELMECEDFIGIHRVVVRGQSPPLLSCQLSNADGLAAVAKKDIANEAAEHVESIVR